MAGRQFVELYAGDPFFCRWKVCSEYCSFQKSICSFSPGDRIFPKRIQAFNAYA
jgi:hypothetical protein